MVAAIGRRGFLVLLAGLGLPRLPACVLTTYRLQSRPELIRLYEQLSGRTKALYLEAIAAAHMPQLLVARGFLPVRQGVFELRTFQLHTSSITCLYHFDDLPARNTAWSALTERTPGLETREISLFRPV